MKKSIGTLSLILLFCLTNFAQINGSLKLGLSGFQGDLHCRTDDNIGVFDELGLSIGAGLHFPISQSVGVRVEGTYFTLKGDESNFSDAGHKARGWSFENKFLEISGLIDYEILGKKRFLENGDFKPTFTPVIFGGLGLAFNRPNVDWKNSTDPDAITDNQESENFEFVVPLGIGLKYYVNERFAVSLETGIRLAFSDYFDGVSLSGNPDKNDGYGFGGVKVYYLLKEKRM